jgi:hypothetical protein
MEATMGNYFVRMPDPGSVAPSQGETRLLARMADGKAKVYEDTQFDTCHP